jgi:hypothetical protein
MKFLFVITLMLLISQNSFAERSMRNCLLLPITDSVGGGIAYKVHEELEDYLKTSGWCVYKSNAGLVSIFSRYRGKLYEHLRNPQVVKVAAQKMNAGSIFRINLVSHITGIEVQLEILGDNGVDIYFSEKVLLNKDDVEVVVQSIKNWLNLYEKNIPYDGRVIGVLGDQVTVDIGKNFRVGIGDEIIIRRVLAKKRHPLLKKIVEWETSILAKGKIFNVSDLQALAVIKTYTSKQKLQEGDWVTLQKAEDVDITRKYNYPEIKANEFGKLGNIQISLELSKSDAQTTVAGPDTQSVGAMILGINIETELWVTRDYFGIFEFGRRFGTLGKKSGVLVQDSVGTTEGVIKVMGGYKFLPLGFFYGPQIDFYGGWGKYSYAMDSIPADGFGENEIGGLIFGVKASLPIKRKFRAFVEAELMPFPSYSETSTNFGGAGSESSLQIELGGKYQYNPVIMLNGSIQMLSNKATFPGNQEVSYRSTAFRFGGSFSF